MNAREALLDLGKKYTYRIFIYCSVFLALYVTLFAFIALVFFDILDYDLSLTIYISGFYDITVVLGILIAMIKIGADINQYFDTFKGIFIQFKKNMWDLKTQGEKVVNKRRRNQKTLKVLHDLIEAQKISYDLKEAYLDENMEFIEIIIQKLEYEKEQKPLKLLGLTVSYDLLKTIYSALATLAFATIQFTYSKYS